MKIFECGEVKEAYAWAQAGGQALHLHQIVFPESPRCFRDAVGRGEDIAHLFDQDEARLRKTAKDLGVRVIYVHHRGTPRQHIDLCGKPLTMAKAIATTLEGLRYQDATKSELMN